MSNIEHKTWLDNEYSLWVKALQESTVHNFKEHPMVKRMLGEVDGQEWFDVWHSLAMKDFIAMRWIDNIGRQKDTPITGTCLRMIYYAGEILKFNPTSIVEIGGGVGQFYAILRALGYMGNYSIVDLPEVLKFQRKYLDEVEKQTGLSVGYKTYDTYLEEIFLISLYALGEFDDETKNRYIKDVVNHIPHGYIAWNAHSGASDDLSLFTHDIKVTEGREPNIKIIQW